MNRNGETTNTRSAILAAAALLGSLAIAVGVVGCTGGDGTDGPTIVEGDGLRLLVAGKVPPGGPDARITGTVALTKGNCLGLDVGEQTALVVWPNGTKITDGRGVDVPDADTLQIGDSIDATGGSSTPSNLGDDMPTVPPQCMTDEVIVINPGSVAKG